MKIFDIINTRVTITPEGLLVPEFKKIWESDKDKMKAQAIKEISYVVFSSDLSKDNPYRGYSEIDKPFVLAEDLFGSKEYVPSKDVLAAIEKYKRMVETPTTRLLKSSRQLVDKLSNHFMDVDFTMKDSYGKYVFDASDAATNLGKLAAIVKSLSALEDMVRNEQLESSMARGGFELGDFEDPDNEFNV